MTPLFLSDPAPTVIRMVSVYVQTTLDELDEPLRTTTFTVVDLETTGFDPDPEYLRELNEAYHHFFFHYDTTPLLVVETSQFESRLP